MRKLILVILLTIVVLLLLDLLKYYELTLTQKRICYGVVIASIIADTIIKNRQKKIKK